MRIKLRLYAKDLDLIAFSEVYDIGDCIRTALYEYVTHGHCLTRFSYPKYDKTIVYSGEKTINVTLNDNKYNEVIKWLKSIHIGLCSSAVKIVLRSAIETPNMTYFMKDGPLQIDKIALMENSTSKTTSTNKLSANKSNSNEPTNLNNKSEQQNQALEDDFDLFNNEFFEVY